MITRSRGRTFQRGSRWWVAYHAPDLQTGRSKEFRESAGTTEADAKRRLRARLGEIYSDTFLGPEADRVTVAELVDAYCEALIQSGKKSIRRTPTGYRGSWAASLRAIREDFGALRARDLTSARIRSFITRRLDGGRARASVQNDVACLRAAFQLAHREGRIRLLPYFPGLTIRNARKVFYEAGEVRALVAALPEPINDLVLAYYLTGRRKREIMPARWEWVDRGARTLTIPDTKNGDPAVLPLEGELAALIERRWRAREVRRADGAVLISPWIFHRRGKPVIKFDRVFANALAAAGITGKTVHDLRRTALRDFVRAGVHQHVAMQMTGHRSAAVFRRYDIVDVEDVRQAIGKTERYRETRTDPDNRAVSVIGRQG